MSDAPHNTTKIPFEETDEFKSFFRMRTIYRELAQTAHAELIHLTVVQSYGEDIVNMGYAALLQKNDRETIHELAKAEKKYYQDNPE